MSELDVLDVGNVFENKAGCLLCLRRWMNEKGAKNSDISSNHLYLLI